MPHWITFNLSNFKIVGKDTKQYLARQTILISRLLFWLQLKAAAPACSYFPSLTLPMIAQPVTFVWSQSLRWTIASALKDLILTVGALTKSGKMEFDSRYNGGNFVRKLTFFCRLVHMTDIFPPLRFSLHPNNHCDIPGKITEIEYRVKYSYNYASFLGFSHM